MLSLGDPFMNVFEKIAPVSSNTNTVFAVIQGVRKLPYLCALVSGCPGFPRKLEIHKERKSQHNNTCDKCRDQMKDDLKYNPGDQHGSDRDCPNHKCMSEPL
jgi:hypothetical protein